MDINSPAEETILKLAFDLVEREGKRVRIVNSESYLLELEFEGKKIQIDEREPRGFGGRRMWVNGKFVAMLENLYN